MEAYKPGFFGRLAGNVMDHPRRWVGLILLMCALSGLLATRIHVDPNVLKLLPMDDPTSQAIQALNAQEGGANLVTIAVRGEDQAKVDAYMRELGDIARANPDVDYALYELDPELAFRLGLLQLKADELRLVKERLSLAIAAGPSVANPFIAATLLDMGPLTQKLAAEQQRTSLTNAHGISRLLIRPKKSAFDASFSVPFVDWLYGEMDKLDAPGRGLEVVWIGGPYRHAVEDIEDITHDLFGTSLSALVLVFILVSIAYRDIRAVFLIFVPLLVGSVWAIGYAGLTVGVLNTFTSFFAAVLLGLGVEYAFHFYSRYVEERAENTVLRDAVVKAWDKTGPPCATAALTCAAGFCSLWLAGFQGFQQLGTIMSGGILLCMAAAAVTLPLLILWREKAPKAVVARSHAKGHTHRKVPDYRLAPMALVVAVLVTAASVLLLERVEFEFDLSKMRKEGMAYEELSADQRALAADSYAPVVVSYDNGESLAADVQRITAAVSEGKMPQVGRVVSIFSVLPLDQAERVSLLREIAELARHENIRYLPANIQKNLQHLASVDLQVMLPADLPHGLQHLLGASDGHHRMMLVPAGNMWDLRENVKLLESVHTYLPGRQAAGEYLAAAMLYKLVAHDAPRIVLGALLAIFLVTWLDVRRFSRALWAVSVLVAGACWAGAALVAFDVKLSLVNYVAIPMTFGIGIDVIIHLLHRIDEEGPGRIRVALLTTGWASMMSTATTVLSCIALSFAVNQGVRSLGLMIMIGETVVTVAGLAIVPLGWMALWSVRRRRQGKRGELPPSD